MGLCVCDVVLNLPDNPNPKKKARPWAGTSEMLQEPKLLVYAVAV
jgi:hypothetical protein